jgi:cytochrome P450
LPIPTDIANTIVDPQAYALGEPVDAAFAELRRTAPFERAEPDGFAPFWVATRHADLQEIEKQAELFSNSARPSVLVPAAAEGLMHAASGGDANLVRSLVATDGEEHLDLRTVALAPFAPPNIRKLEDQTREAARGFVDRMLEAGPTCDFATDVAALLPLRVVMGLLGVPERDEPLLLKLTREIFNSDDPDLNRGGAHGSPVESMQGLVQTVADLEAYFDGMTRSWRDRPADGLGSLIANARIDGEYLNRRQLMGYYLILATNGHYTTSNVMAGALWALAERPALFARLKADPGLINGFIDESIRWVTPVKHFMRTALADTEFQGAKIAQGDWVMLSYQSANRDEEVFADPFTFDETRAPNKQIGFGYGPHLCLGRHLAKLEMRILWEELLPRLEAVELDGQPTRARSNFVCGPKSVPIRFTPAA